MTDEEQQEIVRGQNTRHAEGKAQGAYGGHTMKCQCQNLGVLNTNMAGWYDEKLERPFVNHEPGKCKCTNKMGLYLRRGKQVWLCSNCHLPSDTRLRWAPKRKVKR